jgi:RNA polymerase sigma factor (sigma-70 family)
LRIRWALAGESRMLRKKFRDKPVPPAGREPPDPESEMMARQRQRELRAALARLPDAEQQLVVDHYFHDKPIRQVASERRISRSTAWRRHRTAMGRLRRQLAEVACP